MKFSMRRVAPVKRCAQVVLLLGGVLTPGARAVQTADVPAEHVVAAEWTLERWHVDPARSTVGFDGSSTLHDFTGKTKAVQGELRFDPAALESCAGGAVWVDARTLDTDNSKRDEEMRATLNVTQYPWIAFTLDRVEGRMTDHRGQFRARGRFVVNGYESDKVVAFRTEPLADGALHVLGEVHLSLREHDLKPPSVLFVSVDDDVRVWLDLVLARPADENVPVRVRDVVVTARGAGEPHTTRGAWIEAPGLALWSAAGRGRANAPGRRAGYARGESVETWDPVHGERLDETVPAPVAGRDAPRVERRDVDARTVVVDVDGRECVRLEGLAGDARAAALLPALDAFPPGLGAVLRDVRGLPERVHVVTLDPQGRSLRLDVEFGRDVRDARVPAWALDPSALQLPPRIVTRKLATSQDWRARQKDDG